MIQAILGIAGLGLGLLNFFVGQHQRRQQEKIEAEEGLAETQIGIKEAQYKIGGYEEFLAKVPTAGQALTDTEMRELIRQLEQTATPHTCPHGRPTMIHLSSGQLKREFGRT